MSARVESVTLQLYQDPALRDELTDDEATPMLKWAEGEVARLDAGSADDAAFAAATEALRRLLKAINRFIGQRAFTTPEEQAAALANIAEHAGALGYAMPPERQTAFLQSQASMDNGAALAALLAMIDGSAAEMRPTAPLAPDEAPTPLGWLSKLFQSPAQPTDNSDDNTPSGDRT